MEHDTVACACFFFVCFFLSACAPHASLPPPPVCAADGWERGAGGAGEGGSVETGKIKRRMMDAVIASETTKRIINPHVLLPHPPTPPAPPPLHHPPLMESLPCLSRRRRKLAGSARRQPRPPGRLDPLIRSRRWKPEVGSSTDGGDPHPSSLHHLRPCRSTEWKRSQVRTRMEEEEDDWTAGWRTTRAPSSGHTAEASQSPQHESRLQQQIILRDIQLKLLLFYFYVFGMSHQDSEQEAELCPPTATNIPHRAVGCEDFLSHPS